jgi:hypothetical protein
LRMNTGLSLGNTRSSVTSLKGSPTIGSSAGLVLWLTSAKEWRRLQWSVDGEVCTHTSLGHGFKSYSNVMSIFYSLYLCSRVIRSTSVWYAGSIPGGFVIFYWLKPSGRNVALVSTHPLTDMSTRNLLWGVKAAGAKGWQHCHFHVPIV